MWPEPLFTTVDDEPHTRRFHVYVIATEGPARPVAQVTCAIDKLTRCGVFGEIRITDQRGTARQRVRAMVLLTRAALRHAAEQGIRTVHTDAPDHLERFVADLTGIAGRRHHNRIDYTGDLADIRTHALEHSDGDGNLRR